MVAIIWHTSNVQISLTNETASLKVTYLSLISIKLSVRMYHISSVESNLLLYRQISMIASISLVISVVALSLANS